MSTARSLIARVEALGPDAIAALDDLVSRLELGARQYGLLDLDTSTRDWDDEELAEQADAVWYRTFKRVQAKRAAAIEQRFDVSDEGAL